MTHRRVAVVTGAGGGIGLAITERLVEDGWRVVAADLDVNGLAGIEGESVATVAGDLSVQGGPEAVVARAITTWGRVDALVNNLGISPQRTGFLDVDDDQWNHTLSVNLLCAVRVCRAGIPHLLDVGGVIVNVTSVLTHQPIAEMPDYVAAKAGLRALTSALAAEFSPAGVRVLAVAPGPTLTPQWTATGGQLEVMAAAKGLTIDVVASQHVPATLGMSLGRMVRPEEIATVVAFAVSDDASAMTGSELTVDGGMRVGI